MNPTPSYTESKNNRLHGKKTDRSDGVKRAEP